MLLPPSNHDAKYVLAFSHQVWILWLCGLCCNPLILHAFLVVGISLNQEGEGRGRNYYGIRPKFNPIVR
ncbi:hypothetical protein LY78DRAFT_650313 [Colletotrichum sublineola]|nr:hypothetical protein LY78DRAFT_650313 [Colletotrichum sublineola]